MDRINAAQSAGGSFPINQALRAYAQTPRASRPGGSPFVQAVQPLRPIAEPAPIEPTRRTNPIGSSAPADTVGKIAPKQSPLESSSVGELIGAKVQPIDLVNDVAKVVGPKPMTTSAGTYTMYPQASDRHQVATNIAIGRSLDIQG